MTSKSVVMGQWLQKVSLQASDFKKCRYRPTDFIVELQWIVPKRRFNVSQIPARATCSLNWIAAYCIVFSHILWQKNTNKNLAVIFTCNAEHTVVPSILLYVLAKKLSASQQTSHFKLLGRLATNKMYCWDRGTCVDRDQFYCNSTDGTKHCPVNTTSLKHELSGFVHIRHPRDLTTNCLESNSGPTTITAQD